MKIVFPATLCALCLISLMLPVAAAPAHADPYLEQLAGSEQAGAWDELETWIAGMLVQFINFVQSVSLLVVLAVIIAGAGIFLLGALFGSSILKGTGGSAILAAIGAYLVIKNAPAIILMIQGWRIE